MHKLNKKFYIALTLLGLIGQIAWVVENMYLNVFIYKMFRATAADISLMVALSAVTATATTLLMGALSDKVGKRKVLICGGYIVWGVSILGFSLVRMDVLSPLCETTAQAMSLGVTLTIALDCLMTFFGSTANDAAYNAWLTDMGDEHTRGRIEGINAMMPLVAILCVFGGFMGFDLDKAESWNTIYLIIGAVVLVIGAAGIFLVEDKAVKNEGSYIENLLYSFRPSVVKENLHLYIVLFAFAVFGISIQIFMPYLILYYEKSLGMADYVLIMAPAIVLASVFTALYGRKYDSWGFKKSIMPCLALLMLGYALLYYTWTAAPVFVGSLLMMCGYLGGMAVFGARIRGLIPENMAGRFQGVRIIGQVLIPGVIGPAVGAWVLRNAQQILNSDGTYSFLPNENIFFAAAVAAVAVIVLLGVYFRHQKENGKKTVRGTLPRKTHRKK
ncbi:MAG: MFS transporter [Clostridia bacterium]|nr:MFS transporter [Clostridia bacterium]